MSEVEIGRIIAKTPLTPGEQIERGKKKKENNTNWGSKKEKGK